jgi:hypothetical protein
VKNENHLGCDDLRLVRKTQTMVRTLLSLYFILWIWKFTARVMSNPPPQQKTWEGLVSIKHFFSLAIKFKNFWDVLFLNFSPGLKNYVLRFRIKSTAYFVPCWHREFKDLNFFRKIAPSFRLQNRKFAQILHNNVNAGWYFPEADKTGQSLKGILKGWVAHCGAYYKWRISERLILKRKGSGSNVGENILKIHRKFL